MKSLPTLHVGESAPKFALPDCSGDLVVLDDYLGRSTVILAFYGRDTSLHSTKEMCNLAAELTEFESRGAKVIAISCDSMASHCKMKSRFRVPFPVLCDGGGMVSQMYGVFDGSQAKRTTFVIDEDGTIAHVFQSVNADVHHIDLVNLLAAMSKAKSA